MVSGVITLNHKTSDKFKVDVASMMIKPVGKLSLNNKQGNKKFEAVIK